MNWKNLRDNKCPKCGNLLQKGGNGKQIGYGCSTKGYICTFFIGEEKFTNLVNELYNSQKAVDSRYKDITDNLEALNNLNRPIVTEDFSDSPHLD